MKKIILVIILIGQSFLFGCGHPFVLENIYIVNKSGKAINCQTTDIRKITPTDSDTIYQCQIIPWLIPAGDMRCLEGDEREGGWRGTFRWISYLQFLIMDDSTYMPYFYEPCDTIRKYMPVLHRYQLTLEDLERMNWTVVYPPDSTYNR